MIKKIDNIWGAEYSFEILRRKETESDAPKIIIVTYMFNNDSAEITKLAVESIKRFTEQEYEIWISDLNSTKENFQWVVADRELNFVRNLSISQPRSSGQDSYGNALGLEAATRAIDSQTKYVVIMHSDVVVAANNWLEFVINKLNDKVKGVGFSTDTSRINAMHASGTVFDFDLYYTYKVDFRPNLPHLDVADDITKKITENNFEYVCCKNSFNDKSVIDLIGGESIFKNMHCDRAINDSNEVFFAHLGRGIQKAAGNYFKPNRTGTKQWVNTIKQFLQINE